MKSPRKKIVRKKMALSIRWDSIESRMPRAQEIKIEIKATIDLFPFRKSDKLPSSILPMMAPKSNTVIRFAIS